MTNQNYVNVLIKTIKPNISSNSLIQYNREISNIFSDIANDEQMQNALSEENVNKIVENIESKYASPSTKGFKYNSIIILLKHFYGKDDDRYLRLSQLRDECNRKYSDKEGTTNSKYISNEEYKALLDNMKNETYELMKKEKVSKNDFMSIQSYFLIYIFYYFPFRVDLTPMLILNKRDIPDNQEMNYLQYYNKKWKFIFNSYKTSKSYGQNIVNIDNKEVSKSLSDYFTFLKKYNNQSTNIRLFSNKANNDYILPSNMSTLFKDVFKAKLGKNFNITMNRKRAVSTNPVLQQYRKVRNEAENVAKEMMNSVGVQQSVYMVPKK